MVYNGESLQSCIPLAFASTACVIVSGDGPNPCGHALLYTDGHYFHIAGFFEQPKHMNEEGYRRYVAESGKLELGRYRRHMRFPRAAYAKLTELLAKPWLWGVLPNNCIVFVEEACICAPRTAPRWRITSRCETTCGPMSKRLERTAT